MLLLSLTLLSTITFAEQNNTCDADRAVRLSSIAAANKFGGTKFYANTVKAHCSGISKTVEGKLEENFECLVTLEARNSTVAFYYKYDKDSCALKDSIGLKLAPIIGLDKLDTLPR